MDRTYAGILGLLAFTTFMFREVLGGSDLETAVKGSLVALFAGGAVGYVVGVIGRRTILDSVRWTLKDQLQSGEPASTATES